MLDTDIRTAVFTLKKKGMGIRGVARALNISRNTVRRVLKSGKKEVPSIKRAEKGEAHRDLIIDLYTQCKGNLVRVQEELEGRRIEMPYSTLTAFCRRNDIGVKEKQPSGQYYFKVAEEMQHDTSPHTVEIGGRKRKMQCASLVMCYSRMMYAQVYPTFNRFYCKVFLTEGIKKFQGACKKCMVDNTNVVVARGTGKNAVMAPEMDAFSDRFGFDFAAHEIGDANRSARVERNFHYIENNFYPGRTFSDLSDLNKQLAQWCEKADRRFIDKIQARPIELYQAERPHLKDLPPYIPDVYQLHSRTVDLSGHVRLHTNLYSAPAELIGRQVQVREHIDKVRIFDGHRLVAIHERQEEGKRVRQTLPEHEYTARWKSRKKKSLSIPEEKTLRAAAPELDAMVTALKKKYRGRGVRSIRHLHKMYLDYPTESLSEAVFRALEYGMLDMGRLEKMVLKNIAGSFFRLPVEPNKNVETEQIKEPVNDRRAGSTTEKPSSQEDSRDLGQRGEPSPETKEKA